MDLETGDTAWNFSQGPLRLEILWHHHSISPKWKCWRTLGTLLYFRSGTPFCFRMEPQLSFSNIMFILWEQHLHSMKTNNQGYRNTLLITWEQCSSHLWRWTSKNTSSNWVQPSALWRQTTHNTLLQCGLSGSSTSTLWRWTIRIHSTAVIRDKIVRGNILRRASRQAQMHCGTIKSTLI